LGGILDDDGIVAGSFFAVGVPSPTLNSLA